MGQIKVEKNVGGIEGLCEAIARLMENGSALN